MRSLRRAGKWPAANSLGMLAFIALVALGVEAEAQQTPDDISGMNRLIVELEAWLDLNSPYPRRDDLPTTWIVDATEAPRLAGPPSYDGLVVRGHYDPETARIHLFSPWSPGDARDVAVLLHELVHHRQATSGYWACPAAQEEPAYRLQEAWLAERGIESGINWLAVILDSSCSPKDIHPD